MHYDEQASRATQGLAVCRERPPLCSPLGSISCILLHCPSARATQIPQGAAPSSAKRLTAPPQLRSHPPIGCPAPTPSPLRQGSALYTDFRVFPYVQEYPTSIMASKQKSGGARTRAASAAVAATEQG